MRKLTIILMVMAAISTTFFLFFSDVNRDLGYASMLLLCALVAYRNLTGDKENKTDNNNH